MQLNFKRYGSGQPLIILHGLLGSLDNWATLGKRLAEHLSVYIVDQRNHGRSPHSPDMSFPLMAQDLLEMLDRENIQRTHLLGHSMGGKTAMRFALDHPERLHKLLVVDIAPRQYAEGHEDILEALRELDLDKFESRHEVDIELHKKIPELNTRRFLLKNLSRNSQGGFGWKMNLDGIFRNYAEISVAVNSNVSFKGETLFVQGGRSNYIQAEDHADIRALFPSARTVTIDNAGHWVHADAPDELEQVVMKFLAG